MKNKIKELRKQIGLRQEDIAKELKVTRQTINAIENNKYNPTLELAMRLAKLFNKPVEEIFELTVNGSE
ncbi:helix-turn-helix transcriptional regulator [Methanosarcina mazei]|uniref:ABC transporter substrate-binding protein n=1 Tax=Methanosarcina mazei TaxID=2209 RepID=A0A0F8R9D0_METMZ|nr:helix-turn-helix transcriptional regulator [Methanosarcina mazei]KKG66244.1 ABC transporter substrate-binding protein [Methanosarcina mazei]KKH57614.1 ABC transporter substrate-binding protein [Methanosarcina mazei]